MPRTPLTDITVRTLKFTGKQTHYWDASLPSFSLRVNQRGTKTFNVTIGKDRRLVRIGKYPEISLSEARRRAHEIIANKDVSRITFNAARDLFFSSHLDTLKATTAHEQKNLMRRFPFSQALASITAQDVQRVLDDMPRGSARSCFNVIRTFFNWAVANEHITGSPLKRSPYKAKSRDRLLTDDEILIIWKESYNHNSFGIVLRLLILTGQRLNQITSLKPEWCQYSSSTLSFPAYIMKSNTEHIIPLTPCVQKELQHHQPIKSLSTPMNIFREALPQIPHWTLHDFRRYFSSTCAKLKIPIDITEAILNHTTGSRTAIQRVYDRFDRLDPMRSALETYQDVKRLRRIDQDRRRRVDHPLGCGDAAPRLEARSAA